MILIHQKIIKNYNDSNYKYYKDDYAQKDYKDLSDRAKELVGYCEHFYFTNMKIKMIVCHFGTL